MKGNIYFQGIPNIGDLRLEYIFFEFEQEPILFMCSDKEDILYLCLCSEIRNKQKWIISKCNVDTLKNLINEQVDIGTAIRLQNNIYIVELEVSGKESAYSIETKFIDSLDLPEEGTYLRCDKEKANNYLWNKQLLVLSKNMNILKPIRDITTISYSVALQESFQMANKYIKLYADSLNKVFLKQLEITTKESMIKKNEYNLIISKENENDLNNNVNDSYIEAA